MSENRETDRREVLKSGLALGGLAATAGMPFWSKLALAQGEELVPFTDMADFATPEKKPGGIYFQDTRLVDSFYTPNDQFYVVQHYGHPDVDVANFKLRLTGLVDRELEFSLDDLKGLDKFEIDAGFECGGNRANDLFNGLIGNAKWGGVRLRDLLNAAGVQDDGIEIVFFGADKGKENIRNTDVEQAFGRSMHIDDAMRDEVLVAWEMNGEPLPSIHGAPVRLIVPGWYGVANVKWLEHIHVQDRRYMGRFMARDYVTLSKIDVGGVERWDERSVTWIQLKSSIIRVTRRDDGGHRITGFVLNDGTPLNRVEVQVDGGEWRRAEIDPDSSQYSWKLFYLDWDDAAPGERTIVSRVIDANGQVQATPDQMPEKPSRWENYAQAPRTVMIS